jgi:uncharacterized protein YegP (UPF0339 family)
MDRFELASADVLGDTQYWSRRVAGNGEITWVTEMHPDKRDAIKAIQTLVFRIASEDLDINVRAFTRLYMSDIAYTDCTNSEDRVVRKLYPDGLPLDLIPPAMLEDVDFVLACRAYIDGMPKTGEEATDGAN